MSSASDRRKPSKSASTIVADNAGGYHDFKVEGYSRIKGLPTGVPLKSSPFTVGGHRWRMAFYPDGADAESAGCVTLELYLDEDAAGEVMAMYMFAFLKEVSAPFFRKGTKKVNSRQESMRSFSSRNSWGFPKFIQRSVLEASGAIKDDSLTIRCDIVVINELRTGEVAAPTTSVPPSDLHQHLGELLRTEKGADVVFQVGGETFAAHRCVLAARSPVFSAEFFGAMKESATTSWWSVVVQVDDIEAPVFRALLCFLYTDSVPETRKEDEEALYQHLLVAADRYRMDRLMLICEDKLSKYIDVGKVGYILTLAEQHHSNGLKNACLDFLSAPANLRAVMATDGFEHLSISCPSIKDDLITMLTS